MMTPLRALRRSGSSSPPLPHVHELNALYAAGFVPRRGELIMVAARSGAAKSSFVLWYCIQLGLKTLYFSADMSPWQAGVRTAAAQSGFTIDEIEQMVGRKEIPEEETLSIQFCFDTGPSISDMEDELTAYVEAWDAYPEIIVVDNLRNIWTGRDEERSGWNEVLEYLHEKSRLTGATIFVLHHTQALIDAKNPENPQPKYALKQKVDDLPEQIITLGLNPKNSELRLALVKARMSQCDESGDSFVSLRADQARCQFGAWVGPWSYAS